MLHKLYTAYIKFRYFEVSIVIEKKCQLKLGLQKIFLINWFLKSIDVLRANFDFLLVGDDIIGNSNFSLAFCRFCNDTKIRAEDCSRVAWVRDWLTVDCRTHNVSQCRSWLNFCFSTKCYADMPERFFSVKWPRVLLQLYISYIYARYCTCYRMKYWLFVWTFYYRSRPRLRPVMYKYKTWLLASATATGNSQGQRHKLLDATRSLYSKSIPLTARHQKLPRGSKLFVCD